MKKKIIVFSILVLTLLLSGCSLMEERIEKQNADIPTAENEEKSYHVYVDDEHAGLCNIKSEYHVGEIAAIQLDRMTEHYYTAYLNGDEIQPSEKSTDELWVFEFVMPEKDASVTLVDHWVYPENETDSIDSLINALEENGFDVETENAISQILRGKRVILSLHDSADTKITVYKYADSEKAQMDVSCIDQSGETISMPDKTHYVSWKSTPHFWYSDDLIVQYIGTDQKIIELFSNLYGEQFAGGK